MSPTSIAILAGVGVAHMGLAVYLYNQHFTNRIEPRPDPAPVIIDLPILRPVNPPKPTHSVAQRPVAIHVPDHVPVQAQDAIKVLPPPANPQVDVTKPQVLQAEDIAPQTDAKPKTHLITDPQWASRPTGDELADAYPQRALLAGKSGVVSLACTVLASGALADCMVAEEKPAGWGFGAAALGLTKRFRLVPREEDGTPVGGAMVRIPIRFSLPD